MKLTKYVLLCTLVFSFAFDCDEEEIQEALEDERTNALITFNNDRGISGCFPGYAVTFVVSYRDVQAFIDLEAEGTGFLNVSVTDGESINVQVRRQDNDDVVADASVAVRTTSRPEELEDSARLVSFCQAFDLRFSNF